MNIVIVQNVYVWSISARQRKNAFIKKDKHLIFTNNFLGKGHELKEIAQYITSWEHCAHLPLFFKVYLIEVGSITIARNDLTLMVKYIHLLGSRKLGCPLYMYLYANDGTFFTFQSFDFSSLISSLNSCCQVFIFWWCSADVFVKSKTSEKKFWHLSSLVFLLSLIITQMYGDFFQTSGPN